MNFNSPKIASAGKVVKKATGKSNVKINLNITGYAVIGYLPAANNALSTSVAFHVLTNQILEAAIKNQIE